MALWRCSFLLSSSKVNVWNWKYLSTSRILSYSENENERDDQAARIRDVMNKLRREGRRLTQDDATDRLDAVLKWKAKRDEEKRKEEEKKKNP
jgi:hypothetical protein